MRSFMDAVFSLDDDNDERRSCERFVLASMLSNMQKRCTDYLTEKEALPYSGNPTCTRQSQCLTDNNNDPLLL